MLKLVKNLSFASVGGLLENVIAFLFMVYVARQLGVEDFGKYALVGTIVLLVQYAISIGLEPVAIRTLASDRSQEKTNFQDIISLKFAIGIAAYAILVALNGLLSYSPLVSTLILIHGLGLISSSLVMSYEVYFVSREIQKVPAFFTAFNSLITAVVGIVVLELGGDLYELFVAMFCWAFLFMLLWSGFFCTKVFRFRFTVRFDVWKRLIKEVLPLAPIVAVNRTNRQMNLFMLSKIPGPMPTDLAMGLLQPALTITNVPIRFFMRLRGVFLAWAANQMGRNLSLKHEFALIIQLVTVLFVAPIILGLTYFSEEIIRLVFGEEFIQGAQALVLLGWAAGFNLLIIITEGFVFATDRVLKFVKIYIFVLVVNCVLCITLIPLFGITGAACALLITRFLQFTTLFWYCNKLVPAFSFGIQQMVIPVLTIIVMFTGAEGVSFFVNTIWSKLIVYSIGWGAVICLAATILVRSSNVSTKSADGIA